MFRGAFVVRLAVMTRVFEFPESERWVASGRSFSGSILPQVFQRGLHPPAEVETAELLQGHPRCAAILLRPEGRNVVRACWGRATERDRWAAQGWSTQPGPTCVTRRRVPVEASAGQADGKVAEPSVELVAVSPPTGARFWQRRYLRDLTEERREFLWGEAGAEAEVDWWLGRAERQQAQVEQERERLLLSPETLFQLWHNSSGSRREELGSEPLRAPWDDLARAVQRAYVERLTCCLGGADADEG